MAEPGDEMAAAAAGRGGVRAYLECEQAINALKVAFVQGLLDKDEFDLRLGQAFAARNYAELVALTADLPAGLSPNPQPFLRPGPVVMAATLLYAALWGALILFSPWNHEIARFLLSTTTLTYFAILAVTRLHVLDLRYQERSGGQLPRPPAPGAGGQSSQRPLSADPAGQLPPTDHGQQHTTEAVRRRLYRPSLPGSRSPRRRRPRGLPAAGRAIVVPLPIIMASSAHDEG